MGQPERRSPLAMFWSCLPSCEPEKLPFEKLSGVLEAVQTVEAQLEGMGRVLLRYSGTEPLARVMVEGPDRKTTDEYTDRICETIRRASIK